MCLLSDPKSVCDMGLVPVTRLDLTNYLFDSFECVLSTSLSTKYST